MKVTSYGETLIQLTRWSMMNCYLVREDDGFTLVDTNVFGSADGILNAASAAGGTIRRILLTHAHGDHVGSLDALHTRLPEAEVLIGTREARILASDMSLDPGEPQAKLRGGFPAVTTRPTRTLEAGERVGSLEVIASPGHTPGHIALLDTRDRTLIAGDAFQTRGGIAVAGKWQWRFPFLYFATWHKPTALASARAMRALNPSRLAVGHGRVIDQPAAAMDHAIAAAARAFDSGS